MPAPSTTVPVETEVPYYFAGLPIQLPCDIIDNGGQVYTVHAHYGIAQGPEAGFTPAPARHRRQPRRQRRLDTDPANISYEISGSTQHISNRSRRGRANARDGAQDAP